MAFLGTVITIILSFYLVGFIGKILFRVWINKKMKDFQQGTGGARFGGRKANENTNTPPKSEGEVTITDMGDQDRNIDKNIGEYVDFEEIKEKQSQ